MLREWPWTVVRGVFMGAADVVPGVSGGTIALLFGIYERLIASVKAGSSTLGFALRGDWSAAGDWLRKVEWGFVVPLGAGIVGAVIALAQLLERLLEDEPITMAALFLGLVAGSVVVAWGQVRSWDAARLGIMAATAVAFFVVLGLGGNDSTQASDPGSVAFLGSGAVAICAMILPGISGSFILVLLGMYEPVLESVNDRDFVALGFLMLGAIVGLALFSQVLHRALERAHDTVMAALIGLMAGSLRVLWPWPDGLEGTTLGAPNEDAGAAVTAAVVAFIAVLGLSALGRRLERTELDAGQP